jgi:hypothetical protein
VSASLGAQNNTTRIALVNSNIPSAAILKAINETSKASYTLEAQFNSEYQVERSWLTLFDKNGDALFGTDGLTTGKAVKDVCTYLKLGKR